MKKWPRRSKGVSWWISRSCQIRLDLSCDSAVFHCRRSALFCLRPSCRTLQICRLQWMFVSPGPRPLLKDFKERSTTNGSRCPYVKGRRALTENIFLSWRFFLCSTLWVSDSLRMQVGFTIDIARTPTEIYVLPVLTTLAPRCAEKQTLYPKTVSCGWMLWTWTPGLLRPSQPPSSTTFW